MSSNTTAKFKEIEKQFIKDQGLPFMKALPEEETRELIEQQKINYRERTLTPIITLWAFLSQVLAKSSCRKATENIIAFFASIGEYVSLSDSAYCQARARLSEKLLIKLRRKVAYELQSDLKQQHLWKNREVKVVDGSSFTMADTEKNQEAYPQWMQKEGCGFPIARFVVMFCLSTGTVLESCIDPMSVSERRMLQEIYKHVVPQDIILGDRGCCSYAEIATLLERGVDTVFRVNATKKVDFRQGTHIETYDHIDTWVRPNHKVRWMTSEEYRQLPDDLSLREVRYLIHTPGFRSKKVTLITTLLDANIYTKSDLASLYFRRWETEVNLRHLKTTMKMNFIDSKTPKMVRNQVQVHLLAYNLIRRLMFDSGNLHQVDHLRLSFKGTIDTLASYLPRLSIADEHFTLLYFCFFWSIAQKIVPLRPNRYEPRLIKRRKNPAYSYMTKPRHEYKRSL